MSIFFIISFIIVALTRIIKFLFWLNHLQGDEYRQNELREFNERNATVWDKNAKTSKQLKFYYKICTLQVKLITTRKFHFSKLLYPTRDVYFYKSTTTSEGCSVVNALLSVVGIFLQQGYYNREYPWIVCSICHQVAITPFMRHPCYVCYLSVFCSNVELLWGTREVNGHRKIFYMFNCILINNSVVSINNCLHDKIFILFLFMLKIMFY